MPNGGSFFVLGFGYSLGIGFLELGTWNSVLGHWDFSFERFI